MPGEIRVDYWSTNLSPQGLPCTLFSCPPACTKDTASEPDPDPTLHDGSTRCQIPDMQHIAVAHLACRPIHDRPDKRTPRHASKAEWQMDLLHNHHSVRMAQNQFHSNDDTLPLQAASQRPYASERPCLDPNRIYISWHTFL